MYTQMPVLLSMCVSVCVYIYIYIYIYILIDVPRLLSLYYAQYTNHVGQTKEKRKREYKFKEKSIRLKGR